MWGGGEEGGEFLRGFLHGPPPNIDREVYTMRKSALMDPAAKTIDPLWCDCAALHGGLGRNATIYFLFAPTNID